MRENQVPTEAAGFFGCGLGNVVVCILLSSIVFVSSCASSMTGKHVTQAREAVTAADPFMGDWQGCCKSEHGVVRPLVAQVIALGGGEYRAKLLAAFDKRIEPVAILDGRLQNAAVLLTDQSAPGVHGTIQGESFTGSLKASQHESECGFELKRVFRVSTRLGAKPPAGAIVLFDGKNFDQWKHVKKPEGEPVQWKLVDGAMEVIPHTGSIITKQGFKDFELHMEFRTPFMPEARGQGRGNSGVYLQGRYEVQILDSYALEGRDNECGGIYKVAEPRVNMCAPPTQWQSYDITFRAPRFDAAGNKTASARVTVLHNGVKIHDNVEVPAPTTAALDRNITEPGGIYLQDHGNPVQYRNIWLTELP